MPERAETDPILDGLTRPCVGPSDSSDTPSDLVGAPACNSDSDRRGTGERMAAGTDEVEEAADIGFDRVVESQEAGLGGGLDQAEEAQLGITDEAWQAASATPPQRD